MIRDEPLMLSQVVRFDGEVISIHRLRAHRRAEKIDQGLRLVLRGKPAEAMFRHPGRRVPEGQLDRAALVNAECAVPDLESAR